jgi:hypothetical protein
MSIFRFYDVFNLKKLGELFFSSCIFLIFCTASNAQPLNWSSDIPIISIFTMGNTIVNEPKIQAQWSIFWNSDGTRNTLSQSPHDQGFIGIEYRGQSSQMFPMKSMTVETRNSDGSDREVSLFDFSIESDWVLYATYFDKSLMRNVLSYDLARETGRWAPKTKFVEVWINAEYFGIYVMVEKIKRDKGRVNIKKLDTDENQGIDLSGGYIFKIDKGWVDFYWTSSFPSNFFYPNRLGSSVSFQGVYPKSNRITNAQRNYLTSFIDSMEIALASEAFQDSILGYRRFINTSSFVDFMLVNEVSRNVDAYRISTYFHKDRNDEDGKIHAGPVWDFDLAFANANYCDANSPEGFAFELEEICPAGNWPVPFWWSRLMTDSLFRNEVGCRWQHLRTSVWSESRVLQKIFSYSQETQEARTRHFNRWPIFGQQLWVYPDPIATSYWQELNLLREFILDRWEWLDENLPVGQNCIAHVNPSDSAVDPADSVVNFNSEPMLIISPNPGSSGIQSFDLLVHEGGQLSIRVSDSRGRIISSHKRYVNSGKNNLTGLKSLSLVPGVYFISIQLPSMKFVTSRFIVL